MKLFTAIALTSLLASTASAAPVFPSDRRCILPPACQLIEREGLGCGDIGPGCKGYAVWVADKLRGDAAWFQRVAQGYTEAAWRQGAYDMAGRKYEAYKAVQILIEQNRLGKDPSEGSEEGNRLFP